MLKTTHDAAHRAAVKAVIHADLNLVGDPLLVITGEVDAALTKAMPRLLREVLHDEPVRFLKGSLRLRQVTRLCDGGHQTNVITSRWDLRDIEVAYRMFERWRQENFFKYIREEFLLDALVDYQIEPEDPTRTIPNPERKALDNEIRTARADLARLEREYGAAAADNAEPP